MRSHKRQGAARVSAPINQQFDWDLSRSGLYYALATSEGYVIHYLAFDADTPMELFRDESDTQHYYLAVSRHDDTIVFGASPPPRSELMLVENFR
jgi:hypothetical protein